MKNRNSGGKKKPLDLKGVARIMADPHKSKRIIRDPKPVLKAENLASQIEEFLNSGNTIIKSEAGDRAMPEFTWWRQGYPRNWRKRK